jgi:hypothetical protein
MGAGQFTGTRGFLSNPRSVHDNRSPLGHGERPDGWLRRTPPILLPLSLSPAWSRGALTPKDQRSTGAQTYGSPIKDQRDRLGTRRDFPLTPWSHGPADHQIDRRELRRAVALARALSGSEPLRCRCKRCPDTLGRTPTVTESHFVRRPLLVPLAGRGGRTMVHHSV